MQNKNKDKTIYFAMFLWRIKRFFFIGLKKWLKTSLVILFNIVLIATITIILLMYSSTFQTMVAKLSAYYLSEATGLEVSVAKLSIDVFHTINLHDLIIKDQRQDTMVCLNKLNINIQYNSVIHNKLYIDKITLENPVLKAIRHKGYKTFNYQTLIDFFIKKDTMPSKNNTPFDFKLNAIEIKNATIVYKDEKYNTRFSEQINYDHLKLKNINLFITNIHQKKDTIDFIIKNFSAREQSGMQLIKMNATTQLTPQSAIFKNLSFQTHQSIVNGNVTLFYPSIEDFIDDPEKNMTIDAEFFSPTKIHFQDLYHFAKELKGWNNFVEISGQIKGKVGNLKIINGHLNYAGTIIQGNIEMKGLPDINTTLFTIDAHSFITNAKAIEQIPLYPFDKNEFIELPKQFKNVGVVNYKGIIKGYYHQFKLSGILVTEIGYIKINSTLKIDSITNDLNYKGNFSFIDFNFGKFFKNKNIHTLTADVLLNGKGTMFKNMKTSVQANVKQFGFNDYKYKNMFIDINLDKKILTGDISVTDTNAQFMFSGQINFDNKIPDMNFILSIDKLNLDKLNFLKNSNNGNLSGIITTQLTGNDLDDLTGEINLNNILYTTPDKIYNFFNSKIQLKQDDNFHKTFFFHSGFIDIDINGKFQLSDINNYTNHFLKTFYPSFIKGNYNYHEISKDTFLLNIKLKNFDPFSELLTNKKLTIHPGTYIQVAYHPKDQELLLKSNSDLITYNNIQIHKPNLYIQSNNQQLQSVLKINKITLSDSLYLYNINMCSNSKDNHANTNIEWKTAKDSTTQYTYNGQIGLSTVFLPFGTYIVPNAIEIPVGNDKWIATQLNPIVIDTAGNIDFFPMEVSYKNQTINIFGKLYNQPNDQLNINLNNFQLHQINLLIANSGIRLKGLLNGNITIHQTIKKPFISSNIQIDDFYLNNYFIGKVQTNTQYQPKNNLLNIKGNLSYDYTSIIDKELKYLNFEGNYYTNKKDSSLDIEIQAQPFNLALLNPLLKDIMTIDYALINGKAKITGTPEKPLINGTFKITDSKIKTDYLNTYHKITGNIDVFADQIRFDEMKIYNYGNKDIAGYLNGNIFHKNFNNIRLDFDITAKNLMLLNTTSLQNKDYYGQMYASGTLGIYGYINNINIEANLKTQKNSKFTLSFSHPEEVGENSFIKFINPHDTTTLKNKSTQISGIQMSFILNVTPDLETQVIFNDKTGDAVTAKGEGIIDMKINNYGKFEMNGEYTIQNGTYLFTLESIINKKFEIDKGSKITFVGNPYNTLLNVTANYIQKTSLAPLFPYDSTGNYKRRYPVLSQILLNGKMIAPEIAFKIDVPQVDVATKSKIETLFSDENELNRQFFSLLLLKSFVTPLQYANAGGVSAGNALAANGSEMLSNRLSSALKGISDYVDIGINYNPGSQNSSQQMELTMSKQMFNNKLSIDGSFGVNNYQAQNTSQIIGDVNIEYKLNESGKWVLKAFNRTNNNTQLTMSGGPYTQGIGVGYKYEFNSLFSHLFRRKHKKTDSKNTPASK